MRDPSGQKFRVKKEEISEVIEDAPSNDVFDFIKRWKINHSILAKEMGMPRATFGQKLNEKLQQYSFREEEKVRLLEIIKRIGADISTLI
jgi:hypothetical protein